MIKGALYHRVSTLDQDPELARDELRRAAAARGIEVAITEEETGSGARNDRPGLLRIMDAARQGEVKAVVVWKLDRFGRSTLDLLSNIDALGKAGVRFVAVTQSIDVQPNGDAMSRLILTVISGVAEFERELIRERTLLGLAKASKLGHRSGRPPIGPEDQRHIESLFEGGLGAYLIAKQLRLKETTVRRYVRRLESAKKGTPQGGL